MNTILERIRKEILTWPNVTAEPHRFGGIEFRLRGNGGICMANI